VKVTGLQENLPIRLVLKNPQQLGVQFLPVLNKEAVVLRNERRRVISRFVIIAAWAIEISMYCDQVQYMNLFVGIGLLCDKISGGLYGWLGQLVQVPFTVNKRVEDLQHKQPQMRNFFN
jgi:hypothetical protein